MRRRLVVAFGSLALAVIVLFGVPRGIVLAQLVEAERSALLDKSADLAAFAVSDAVERGETVSPELLEPALDEGEVLEYRPADGPAVVVPGTAEPATGDDLTADRTLPGGGSLTASYPAGSLRDDVVRVLAPMAALALLLVLLAGVMGWLMARRLARPFTELAGVAEDIGRGHLDVQVPHYAIAEAEAIARALDDATQTVRRMVRREREVSDHASHDLRTPITALRLTLEDLSLWPGTPPDVAEELTRIVGEVDRFSAAVATLVDVPAAATDVQLVDAAALLRKAVRERSERGGQVRVRAADPVLARLPARSVHRAVALLLEHVAGCAVGVEADVVDGRGYLVVGLRGQCQDPAAADDVVWDQAVGVAVELGGRLTSTRQGDGRASWSLTLPKEDPHDSPEHRR